MHTCSIMRSLELTPGDMSDYEQLAAYHYREERPVAVKAVYVLRPKKPLGSFGRRAAGVIVYTMPNPRVELRTVATGGLFAGLDRQTELAMLNRNIRCIARVIVEPRLRGIGLATRLVRETMPGMNVPIVEALGVMPLVNPFLERAGMKVFEPRVPVEHVKLIEAFSAVDVEESDLVSPQIVQDRLDELSGPRAAFIEQHILEFLKSHNTRRMMPPGLERTRYLLGKLTHRPSYYIWINPLIKDDWRLMISDPRPAPSSIDHRTSTINHLKAEVTSR
ncbi:MAG: hypothetical protein ABFE01_22885 [Phycisphaerales bacterium]